MTQEYMDYLAHHGVKGQKWGVRRYQNEDGSLTEEGKNRYGTSENYEKQKALEKASNEYFSSVKKQNSAFSMFRGREENEKIARDVADKQLKVRRAMAEAFHSTINTDKVSNKDKEKARKALHNLQRQNYGKMIDRLKKEMPEHRFNYDSSGRIVGISKVGDTNMKMFFDIDPSLEAVYDSDGKLIAKRHNK